MTDTTTPVGVAEAIAHLRDLRPAESQVFTTEQLRTIANDVYNARPLEHTMARPELADIAVADVLGIVEEFGKHRARVLKLGPSESVQAAEIGMLPLPGIQPSREEILHIDAKVAAEKKLTKAEQRVWDAVGGNRVVIPFGYEHGAYQTRNIDASLRALVRSRPTDAEIERFVVRHFERPTAVLSADHVHLLHWMLRNGLAHKLLELRPAEHTLAQMLVRSYELLDVARLDARDGIAALAQADPEKADVTDLRGHAARASWLFPAEFARLDKVLAEVEKAPTDPRLRTLLATKLRSFCAWLGASSVAAALVSIEHMTEGHLLGILRNTGLAGDEQEEKQVVAHLRAKLTACGLGNDLDREIPEGVKAWRLGRLEEFLSSREARAAGDPDWAVTYAEAIAEATAAEELTGA